MCIMQLNQLPYGYVKGLMCVCVYTHTEVVKQLAEQHNLPLKTGYNTIRGFHVQLYIGPGAGDVVQGLSLESLPRDFMKPSKNRNTISFTTADMVGNNSALIYIICLLCTD